MKRQTKRRVKDVITVWEITETRVKSCQCRNTRVSRDITHGDVGAGTCKQHSRDTLEVGQDSPLSDVTQTS